MFGDVVGEWRAKPAATLAGLDEIRGGEMTVAQNLEYVTFDDGTQGFKEVEGEAVAVLLVGVQDANTGLEPDGESGDACFGLSQGVAVVE